MITKHLLELKKEMQFEAYKWNGDSLLGEDKAHIAEDIIEKVDELLELINEFNETN